MLPKLETDWGNPVHQTITNIAPVSHKQVKDFCS